MCFFNFRAFSYLIRSLFPLKDELAARKTYFTLPMTVSFQYASHVTVGSCTTPFQA